MRYLLTLDVGTTAVKSCIYSEYLQPAALSHEEYGLLTPAPGIVEQDPGIYWEASARGIKNVLASACIDPADICAISITTQGETFVPVDANGEPLGNAIVWLDARAEEEASLISAAFPASKVYPVTGMSGIGPASPAAKLLWIRRNRPEVFWKTHKFLLLADYLVYRLTGRFTTDRCIMSSTGYLDINSGGLWQEMLDFIGVGPGTLPDIRDPGTDAGGILPEAADHFGVNPCAIVTTAGMDQAASAVGAGNILPGMISETTGTALVVAATVDRPDYGNAAMLNIMRHAAKNRFLVLPYNQTAGMALRWFRDEFCPQEMNQCGMETKAAYACLDKMAEAVPPLSGGLIFLPHMAGMLTPEVNPAVRGVFFGAGLDTGRPHFIRSILEGVAFMLRENIRLLEGMGIAAEEIRSLGGGSKSPLWCKIKADITKKAILVMEQDEATSYGAAILGSLAAGIYGSIEDACGVVKIKDRCLPDSTNARLYEQGFQKYRRLYASLKGMF